MKPAVQSNAHRPTRSQRTGRESESLSRQAAKSHGSNRTQPVALAHNESTSAYPQRNLASLGSVAIRRLSIGRWSDSRSRSGAMSWRTRPARGEGIGGAI